MRLKFFSSFFSFNLAENLVAHITWFFFSYLLVACGGGNVLSMFLLK